MEHRKGKNDQIRYLAEEEKMKSKPLWNQCFPEDSPAFVSDYYREKTKNNRILVKMEGDAILTMLQPESLCASLEGYAVDGGLYRGSGDERCRPET